MDLFHLSVILPQGYGTAMPVYEKYGIYKKQGSRLPIARNLNYRGASEGTADQFNISTAQEGIIWPGVDISPVGWKILLYLQVILFKMGLTYQTVVAMVANVQFMVTGFLMTGTRSFFVFVVVKSTKRGKCYGKYP